MMIFKHLSFTATKNEIVENNNFISKVKSKKTDEPYIFEDFIGKKEKQGEQFNVFNEFNIHTLLYFYELRNHEISDFCDVLTTIGEQNENQKFEDINLHFLSVLRNCSFLVKKLAGHVGNNMCEIFDLIVYPRLYEDIMDKTQDDDPYFGAYCINMIEILLNEAYYSLIIHKKTPTNIEELKRSLHEFRKVIG
jgi:hypothetical protein